MLGILFSSFYIFTKSIQYITTKSHRIITVVWCFLWAFLHAIAPFFMQLPFATPLVCFASVIFTYILTKQKLETVVSAYLLSFGISLVLYYIATAVVSFVAMFFLGSEHYDTALIDYNEPIYLLLYSLIFAVQFVLSVLLFRIRLFRKGFPFIFNKFAIVIALFFTGGILIIVTWVNMITRLEDDFLENRLSAYIYAVGVLIAGVGIYILISRLISIFQERKVQQNAESHFEKLYLEEKAKNEELNRQIRAKSAVIHNFTDRLQAMEEAVALQKDWDEELDKIKGKTALPSTNVVAIDNLLKFYARQFKAEKITFNVMTNGSIKYMVEKVIKQGDLEVLIANHLNDAKKAVNASDNTFRNITAVIGVSGKHYEFSVLDSGIAFEVDTLVRLGTERVTTHADTGGGGIGFETTFRTMRETGASLIINEQEQSNVDYSKSVTIRFDGKNRYIIETYRPDEFPESSRFTVVTPQYSV